ncbi:MAG: glycosyltransferase family 2 protein, partial [Bacteroidota bacterium]
DSVFQKKSGHVTYAPTCFLWVRAEVFDKIGLMDEKYFAYYDDTDFALRAIRSGYTIWYESNLVLFHKVSSSSGGDYSPFYIYFSNRNKIYYIKKNYSGLYKYYLLLYTLLSRCFYLFKYNKLGREKMIKGIKDGFLMSLKKLD